MDGNEIRNENMRVRGERKNRKTRGEVYEISLGADSRTLGYMIKEELQRDKLRRRAGGWAWGYKKRLSEERGSDLAKKCWEEVKERRGEDDIRMGEKKEIFRG